MIFTLNYLGIKHIPIAGRDVTYFVQQLLREREPNIPAEQSYEVAKTIKVILPFFKLFIDACFQEKYCYVCPDIQKEFAKFDTDPDKWFKIYDGINNITKKPFQIDVGYERFLAPEIFFHPEVCFTFYVI